MRNWTESHNIQNKSSLSTMSVRYTKYHIEIVRKRGRERAECGHHVEQTNNQMFDVFVSIFQAILCCFPIDNISFAFPKFIYQLNAMVSFLLCVRIRNASKCKWLKMSWRWHTLNAWIITVASVYWILLKAYLNGCTARWAGYGWNGTVWYT